MVLLIVPLIMILILPLLNRQQWSLWYTLIVPLLMKLLMLPLMIP